MKIPRTTKQQTEELKAAIFRCFNELQVEEQPYSLIEWAKANPKEFYTGLLPRLLPKPVEISAEAGIQFQLLYHIGDQIVAIGADGRPALLDEPNGQAVGCKPVALPVQACPELPDPNVVDVEVVGEQELGAAPAADLVQTSCAASSKAICPSRMLN